jgi:2-polyprenyl-6-methoxyphenol hydroxylase-like FAD-dependent oxidoreductase
VDRVRRVIVVGAGVAGLACALAAARAGMSVEVLDARPRLNDVSGHVDVVPNLLRDLEQLGVGQACARSGFAYSRIAVADARGRPLYELPLRRLAGPTLPPALGMQHADLLRVLDAAASQLGAVVTLGRPATAIDSLASPATVQLADGSTRTGDLVVVACGADSPLRSQVIPSARPTSALDQSWWHALVPRPPGLDQPTWWIGTAQRVLCVPVGATRCGLALIRAGAPDDQAVSASPMREALREFSALPVSVLASFDGDVTPITRRRVREGVLAQWHRGRALCVGEAAHALVPHFGQSAAQSIEDACVLGELLGQGTGLADLLQHFGERRIARAGRVQALTSQAARWDLRPQADTDLRQLALRLDALVAEPA